MLIALDAAKLLVTGGAGFMGSSFIRVLLNDPTFRGHIYNVDKLTYCGNLDNLKEVEKDSRYSFIQADICDKKAMKEIVEKISLDGIVHFAAETHVDRSIENGESFVKTNVLGTFNLLDILREHRHVHFHHVSTDEVYGSLHKEGYFDENSPYLPSSPYSASKAASDHLVRAFHQTYHLSTTLSHAGNNYGPYQYPEKLIPLMITKMIDQKKLPIYGNGLNVRDWVYVDDHARAICSILRFGKKGETYNVASGAELSNLDLVKLLIHYFSIITKQDPTCHQIEFVKDRPGHDFRYAMKASKLKKTTGWKPEVSLEMGLQKTIQWYLDSKDWLQELQSKKQGEICVSI